MSDDNQPFQMKGDQKILDLQNYCGFFFVVIANRLSRGASAQYRKEYGVGVVEWRCLVSLAMGQSTTAAQISQTNSMNKSLVSRSLNKLEELGMVEDCTTSAKRKPRFLKLTAKGADLYAQMIEDTLLREEEFRKGLTDEDVANLLRMLRILVCNAHHLDQISTS